MVWELRDGPDLVGLHLRRADAEADQGILRAQRRVTADGGPVLPGLLDGDLDITVSATVVHAGRQQHLDGPT